MMHVRELIEAVERKGLKPLIEECAELNRLEKKAKMEDAAKRLKEAERRQRATNGGRRAADAAQRVGGTAAGRRPPRTYMTSDLVE